MSEWIKCSERLPDCEYGELLVLIGDKKFIATCIRLGEPYRSDEIFWIGDRHIECGFRRLGGWRIPSHYKEPSHWMRIPAPPEDL